MGVGVKAKQIVLLGPDCSGKTTLSQKIASHYGLEAIPNRKIRESGHLHHQMALRIRELHFGAPMLLDQWQFPVDIVYESALGAGKSPLMHNYDRIVEALSYTDILFVYLDASDEAIKERFEERGGDELWSLEQIYKVSAAYRAFMFPFSYDLPVLKIDTTGKDQNTVWLEVQEGLNKHFEKKTNCIVREGV